MNGDSELQHGEFSNETTASAAGIAADAAKQGSRAVKYTLLMGLFFLLPNTGALAAGLVGFFSAGITGLKGLYLFLIILAGAASCVAAAYCTYRFLIIDTIRISYGYLTPLFRKLCGGIAEKIAAGSESPIKKGYDWAETIADSFQEAYNSRIPWLIRKGVQFILEQIPFGDIMYHVSVDTSGEAPQVGESLYTQTDAYIKKRFFAGNSMNWVLWLLPANTILQFIFLKLIFK
ncbi:hypothetical protein [Breznakiella homolactica]|uniref:Uncharacterized protein n=1 Tax=Breznakiella homolactica TaxID=2798577 RepID=A0A7T8BAS4_9SPIR|nr:hypothetical protein [Breznakiella homolactica]QQO08463.1 hypothetical protein JFL75_16220 [Breznakiella homolactica]